MYYKYKYDYEKDFNVYGNYDCRGFSFFLQFV